MSLSFLIIGLLLFQTPTQDPAQQQRRNRFIVALEESIKGKENEPAEKVFKNIQTFKGMPAASVLQIMERDFVPSLGVNCRYCHTLEQWETDENEHKIVARKMWAMQEDLSKQLRTITGKSDASVTCATCHRGDTKPATMLPSQRRGG
jgi:hypothetical protein